MELEFFASCLGGFEQALADELRSLQIERTRPLGGGVAFFCSASKAYEACLWSRIASRIMLVLGRVNAGDADLLYRGAYDLAWEDILASDAAFTVRAHGTNGQLRNTRFTALKVKDAIVDRLRSLGEGRRASDADAPRAAIDVRIREARATISLDFSGQALNHRTYLLEDDRRDAAYECTLAAGSLALMGWNADTAKLASFVDPVCRDGILLVEAALIACDCAPGLTRSRWGFGAWAHYDEREWNLLIGQARERYSRGLERCVGGGARDSAPNARPDTSRVCFVGASTSSPSISQAREHAKRAGVRPIVSVELADATTIDALVMRSCRNASRHIGPDAVNDVHAGLACMVASNLDAQARSDAHALVQSDEATFVAACGAAFREAPVAKALAVGAQELGARYATEPIRSIRVGHGRVENSIEIYSAAPREGVAVEIPDLSGGAPHRVEVLERASEQFASRLRKVFKERRKWASREGITCYRIYDADLPDYSVAIDWYTGAGDARGNSYLHIAEYAPPSSVDAGKAQRRFNDVLAVAPIVCGVRPDHVFSKRRVRDKGGSQYRNAGRRAYPTTVEEGGYIFEVDLASRLDTGLFLDHRITRQLVAERASGARFLNLFAYTGSATVYAAGNGAVSTVTVDLSQTYLDWASRNMLANGFTGRSHEFIRGDVMRWITEVRRSQRRFDLVFVDPPTFSNSKAMGKKTWDVQRDHVELLIGVTHLLADGGQAIFSCNLRSFKPNLDELERYGVRIEDVSPDTIPYDFARTPKIHKCYVVTRMPKDGIS